MDAEELMIENNLLMHKVLDELKELKQKLDKPVVDTNACTGEEALRILGLGNPRYLTYYHKVEKVLSRQSGGKDGFTYYKDQCQQLAEAFRNGKVIPSIKAIYAK